MSLRRSVLVVVLMLALMTALPPSRAETANVIDVTHSPDVPESGEIVKITLKFDNATDITKVEIIYCKFDPINCEFPLNMTRDSLDSNVFTHNLTKTYDPGTKVGFKFKIYNSSSINPRDFPNSMDNANLHPVMEVEEFHYFYFTLESKPVIDSTNYLWLIIIVLVVAILPLLAAIALWMKKRKGRKDEGEK